MRLRPLWERAQNVAAARLLGRNERFDYWQRRGYHVLPVSFYSPIPDTRTLRDDLWEQPHALVGVDLAVPDQLHRLRSYRDRFADEYLALPRTSPGDALGLALDNTSYSNGDPELLYCAIRDLKPSRVVEVGSGMSTLVIDRALTANEAEGAAACQYTIVDPFAAEHVSATSTVTDVRARPVQEVELALFESLASGDVLFIDSTHVVAPGSDVVRLVLDVLPRLAVGVHVHLHDIHLPYEHDRTWIVDRHFFWSEQHLLAAFLTLNPSFRVVWSTHHLHRDHREALAGAFPGARRARGRPSSFWIARVT